MGSDLLLRRKLTLRAHGRQVVFVKRHHESLEHVLMKAFLWALYLPAYPDLAVETAVGDRYKPDVVALDAHGEPRFWGEAGRVGAGKLASLLRRHRATHFAFAKWSAALTPHAALIEAALEGRPRQAPVDLVAFPGDSAERFLTPEGRLCLTHADLTWRRFGGRQQILP